MTSEIVNEVDTSAGETGGRRLSWSLAGAVYFGTVFGAGFMLGAVRALLVAPWLGDRTAELIEMPVMLIVIIAAASWTVRGFHLSARPGRDRIAMGAVALALTLLFEFGLVLTLRHETLAEYFRTRDPVSGTAYYLMLLVFAFMPVLVGRGVRAVRVAAQAVL